MADLIPQSMNLMDVIWDLLNAANDESWTSVDKIKTRLEQLNISPRLHSLFMEVLGFEATGSGTQTWYVMSEVSPGEYFNITGKVAV